MDGITHVKALNCPPHWGAHIKPDWKGTVFDFGREKATLQLDLSALYNALTLKRDTALDGVSVRFMKTKPKFSLLWWTWWHYEVWFQLREPAGGTADLLIVDRDDLLYAVRMVL